MRVPLLETGAESVRVTLLEIPVPRRSDIVAGEASAMAGEASAMACRLKMEARLFGGTDAFLCIDCCSSAKEPSTAFSSVAQRRHAFELATRVHDTRVRVHDERDGG